MTEERDEREPELSASAKVESRQSSAVEAASLKRLTGRPRLEFDLRQVEELGRIQSTLAELAALLGCGLSTVKDRLANDPDFAAAYESGLQAGKASLRGLQWKAALGGNTTMQIWLGKQYLNQKDRQEVGGDQEHPLQILVE